MPNFVKHSRCPKCGSEDNVAVHDNGFEICYSQGCDYVKHSNDDHNYRSNNLGTPNNPVSYYPQLDGDVPVVFVEYKGLTRESLNDYGIKKVKFPNGSEAIQFPYYLNGVSVAAKYRSCKSATGANNWNSKNFWSKGTISQCRLFGMQTCTKRKKGLIITEGELDALAAYSMYGMANNVVSVANGAQSAVKAIQHHIDWVMEYETIYINFDMDDPGQSAANEVMAMFPPGKAKNVVLPEGYKDACDMSKAKMGEQYRKCVKSAQGVTPQGVLDKDDVINSTLRYIMDIDQRKGISTGYKRLDDVMGGFRPGELVTLVAGTGVGKTTVTLNMTYNAAMLSNMKTLFIPLEMSYKQVLVRLMEIHMKQPIMTTTDNISPQLMDESKLRATLDEVTENVSIYNHIGALNLAKLISVIEYYAISQKTKLIVLDHKDAAVNSLTDEGGGVKLIDNLMAELKRIAIQYDLTVLVVSHQSRSKEDREDSKASLSRVRGSAGVAQNSDLVLGIERERNSNELTMITLKAHRIFGIYDRFSLYYNRDTLRIEEAEYEDINEVTVNEKAEDEERVREEDKSQSPKPVIRAEKVPIQTQLHTRLSTTDGQREGDIHRSQRLLSAARQVEADSSPRGEPEPRLKDFISKRKSPGKSKIETLVHLRRLGDKKQIYMGGRRKNTV